MINYLRIRNIAVIEKAELNLEKGFIVLTGETGAGKSIIVGGFKLLLSGKGDPDMIRSGEEAGKIEGIIDEETTAAVEIGRKRSRGYLNGELVPLKKIASELSSKIDIFGQRDHYFLLDSGNHLLFLDRFLGLEDLRKKVSSLWEAIREKQDTLTKARKEREERERKKEFLRFQIDEIDRAKLKIGEEEKLREKRELILKRERLREIIGRLSNELEGERGAKERLWEMSRDLQELSLTFKSIKPYSSELESFLSVLSDLSYAIGEKTSLIEDTEGNIEDIEQRLSLIESLKKKYGNSIEDIVRYGKSAEEKLKEIEESEIEERLEKELEELWNNYKEVAKRLSEKRAKGAVKLKKEVEKRLKNLSVEKPQFNIELKEKEPYEFGIEEGEFFFSANPGEEPRPLKKVASGGELSRIMLSLKSLNAEEGKTFVFDEIDSGIGGKTAYTLGKMLKALSKKNQTIVVTHLPHVAAFADQHFLIEKKVVGERTFTYVKEVKGKKRVGEISRMLVGEESESGLKSAEELLQKASAFG